MIEEALSSAHRSTARVAGAMSLSLASRKFSPTVAKGWIKTLRNAADALEKTFLSSSSQAKLVDTPQSPEVPK